MAEKDDTKPVSQSRIPADRRKRIEPRPSARKCSRWRSLLASITPENIHLRPIGAHRLERNSGSKMTRRLFCAALLMCAGLAASADNWPGWRGPLGTGHSLEQGLPVKWSAASGENVRWKTPLPGPGMSSPVVWGSRIFVTQALDPGGRQRAILCFDRKDGRQLWQRAVEYAEKESTYSGEPHYASASPVTDGERVVASFGSAGVLCCDMNGKQLWHRDLGKAEQIWGNASSPVIHGDLVILNFGPGERTFLIAMNKRTGADAWKIEIPGGKYGTNNADWNGSWSTPVVARIGGRDELIVPWANVLCSYDPKTGSELWSCRGAGPLQYASPLVGQDVIVVTSGFGGAAMAVRTGGKGDVTESHRLWVTDRRMPQRVGSGVMVGDHVYILNEPGNAECIEAKTGKSVWNERVSSGSWGSMVHADGKLYVTNQKGETLVLAARPTHEVISRNPLDERSQSSPAVSDGDIFIRTYKHLWCIGKK